MGEKNGGEKMGGKKWMKEKGMGWMEGRRDMVLGGEK